jgi:hypothetical protein
VARSRILLLAAGIATIAFARDDIVLLYPKPFAAMSDYTPPLLSATKALTRISSENWRQFSAEDRLTL